jgi:putative copper export protein
VNWLQFGVQWLHVLLGILWFGYALSMHFLISPPLMKLPEAQQRDAFFRLGEIGPRVFPIVAGLVILLGIVRGTVFGPIQSLDALFGTAYGWTWLVALITTVALVVNGARNVGPTTVALKDTPDFAGTVARLQRYSTIDIGLFLVVFSCMILMRFGL